mgnify:FL=1
MESIKKEIIEKFEDNPRIMFARTLAEFNITILEIYEAFINFIFDKLVSYKNKIDELIETRPDIIYKSESEFNGFIMYEKKDGNIHCFDPTKNPKKMVENILKKLLNDLNKNKNKFNEIFKFKIIKEVNYKNIENKK